MNRNYKKMWLRGMAAYQQQKFHLDPQVGCSSDTRRGITLLARLSQPIKDEATRFLTELNDICPNQYCYPQSDMHLTLMSIVSCQPYYLFDDNLAQQYLAALRPQLTAISSGRALSVDFSGITLSDAAVLLTGGTDKVQLAQLRNVIRGAILTSGLAHSMDSRYKIDTAHSTVFRYQTQPKNCQQLIKFLQKNRHREFGSMQVESLELVFNDWYQTKQNTRLIGYITLAL